MLYIIRNLNIFSFRSVVRTQNEERFNIETRENSSGKK
jgi:hypothetical protein